MKLLLIEDDPVMGEALHMRFEIEGLTTRWCRRLDESRKAYETGWDVVVSDVCLPDGLATEWFHSLPPDQRRNAWFFLTGYGSVEQAAQANRAGARAYMIKPFDVEQLVAQVRAIDRINDAGVLGPSAAMRQLENTIRRVASQPVSVLITGESGVGKEVAAQRLHQLDPARHRGPFVAVNCAAIPEQMLEAEFFGYERGAFTGAQRSHKGFLEQANGGTIFLDEVADLSAPLQAKLLRALQEKAFYRLGAERLTRSDFRVVSATNRDLYEQAQQGLFREDLYYRLAVVRLHIPPLRERPEDIRWLATKILQELALAQHRPLAISDNLMDWLVSQPWRGNVRELKSFLERETALSEHGLLDTESLSFTLPAPPRASQTHPWPIDAPLQTVIDDAERMHIAHVLTATGGNISKAAQQLAISRKTLWEKMRRHGIAREKPPAADST